LERGRGAFVDDEIITVLVREFRDAAAEIVGGCFQKTALKVLQVLLALRVPPALRVRKVPGVLKVK
jgi:hypothetical protein